VSTDRSNDPQLGESLLAIYDQALSCVYWILAVEGGEPETAEDLTSPTFLAALSALEVNPTLMVTTAWLVGIARHKMVDHWRVQERSGVRHRLLVGQQDRAHDSWDVGFDALVVWRFSRSWHELSGTWVLGRRPASESGRVVYIMVASAARPSAAVVATGGEIIRPFDPASPEVHLTFSDTTGNVMGVYQQPGLEESEAEGAS